MSSVNNNGGGGGWLGYFGFGGGEHTCDPTCNHQEEVERVEDHTCDTTCNHDRQEDVETLEEHTCDVTCSHDQGEDVGSLEEHNCHDNCPHQQTFWSYWTRSGGGEYCVEIAVNEHEGCRDEFLVEVQEEVPDEE
ncbi:MAG: hypothetical protein K2Y01_04975 [Rhabdochlamydiaceae bacterium]|nr:hypothetical protein [Rhabdochlamydiaceae bacterium]